MSEPFDMSAALATFIEEANELLAEMETLLLGFENEGVATDEINALFRAAHTFKGSAGLFGLDYIVDFAHVMESMLDRVRGGEQKLDPQGIQALLEARDHLATLVGIAEQAGEPDAGVLSLSAALGERLGAARSEPTKPRAGVPATAGSAPLLSPGEAVESVISTLTRREQPGGWHISLRFGPDTFRNGMDPLSFIRYLGSLGELAGVETMLDGAPEGQAFDPECCHLGFEINFRGDIDKQTIENVFEFVEDDCEVRILPSSSKLQAFVELIQTLPEDDMRLGEILVGVGTLTERELQQALALQAEAADGTEPLGQVLVGRGVVESTVVEAALEKQSRVKETRARDSRVVRVQADKLDTLIDGVGELVIATSTVMELATQAHNPDQLQAAAEVARLVEVIREGALRLRMVEIRDTFTRFHRVVRDVAREVGKEVQLVLRGEDTELDRAVVDKIADPLTHMVRNAIDHGIETPDVRTAAGKPAQGTIRLQAYHDSGNVVVEIVDDGAGLDPVRIRAKAVERGLIDPEQQLAENEIFPLIFEPGFSTAEKVSDLSGRGVGMDVVKQVIESLHGSVEVESSQGEGTLVRLRLPLTLAIIDGFLLGVGDARYVLPLDSVVECTDFAGVEERSRYGDYVKLRDTVLPYLRLDDFFGQHRGPVQREGLVVVQSGSERIGLVAGELLGEIQAVVKPLGELFHHLKGIGGSTILGSGKLALILDVPGLIQAAVQNETAARRQEFSGRTQNAATI
jgi:two-component system, chemotaxis family, sensor kinase CheA